MTSKIGPEQCPQAIGTVQGCGVPGCPICMPAEGRDLNSNFLIVGNGDGEITVAYGLIEESLRRNIIIDGAQTNRFDSKRQALEQAEKQAREPVKKYLLSAEHKVSWEDIVGNEDAHQAMVEAIEFPIKHKALFKHYNKKMTKGILLKGPPGCGKTMLGKAAASVIAQLSGSKTSAILSVKATELQQPYVGQTEKIIRNIFAYAKAYKALYEHQLVVFIDEADAILPARQGSGGTRGVAGWEESNVATFLSEMDGMEESGALVILATNRPNAIDTALLRDGRIDRKITVNRPTQRSARIIFERAFRMAPIDKSIIIAACGGPPSLDNRDYLVNLAMETFFDPTRHLLKIKTEKGVDYLTLSNVVSGAMMVGLVERMKALAFHRDIAEGTMTGITEHEVIKAIDMLTEEQREQPDIYALTEFASRVNAQVLEVDKVRAPEIKYVGTLQ